MRFAKISAIKVGDMDHTAVLMQLAWSADQLHRIDFPNAEKAQSAE